jgi:hypothetical protein
LNQAFHLTNPVAIRVSKLFELISSLKSSIRQVPFQEWFQEILALSEGGPKNPLASFIPFLKGKTIMGLMSAKTLLLIDCRKTVETLEKGSIFCPPPDTRLFAPYFSYLTRSGFLKEAQRPGEPLLI